MKKSFKIFQAVLCLIRKKIIWCGNYKIFHMISNFNWRMNLPRKYQNECDDSNIWMAKQKADSLWLFFARTDDYTWKIPLFWQLIQSHILHSYSLQHCFGFFVSALWGQPPWTLRNVTMKWKKVLVAKLKWKSFKVLPLFIYANTFVVVVSKPFSDLIHPQH